VVDVAHPELVDGGGCLRLGYSLADPEPEVEGSVDVHPAEVASENYPEVVPSDLDYLGPKSRKNLSEMAA